MNIIGEAGIRISAITRDLRRVLQKTVNDSLKGLRASKQNALTELQRELNKGELTLADATRKRTAAVKAASAAERALVALRESGTASASELAEAEEKHRTALLRQRVAIDNVAAAQERVRGIQERMRRTTLGLDRDTAILGKSFGLLRKELSLVANGLSTSIVQFGKVSLIGVAAAGAVAGVTSLTLGLGALIAALGQAAGAAGLLPAVLAGKWAVIGTAKLAMQGLDDAMKAVVSGDSAALDEALKDLAPSARNFVREINKVKPAFDGMRLDVQQKLFAGLGQSIAPLAARYLPQANLLFGSMSSTMNAMAKDLVNFAMSNRALAGTQTTVNNLKSAFGTLRPAVAPAAEAILNVVSVGSTFLPRLTSQFSAGIQGISKRITEMARTGELEAFFQKALDTIAQLGRIAGNVGTTIGGVFRAAQSAGGGLLNNLEQMTAAMSRFVNSGRGQEALTGFFAAMRQVTSALGPVLGQVATIIGTQLAPIIANMATTILPALMPALEAFGRLLEAAAPLIDVLSEAFASLLVAFAPVIDMFAQALADVMPQLIPAVMAIGEALVQLITAAAPLVPLFVQLVAALLPILPPILQLVSALLPPLISIIQALMPVIGALVQAFVAVMPVVTAVAQVLAAILVPVVRVVAAIITGAINVVIGIFNALKAGVTGAIRGVVAAIGWIGQLPGRVIGWFSALKDGAINRAIALWNWLKGLPGKILGALGDLGSLLLNAGKNIIMGLLNGLKSAAGAVLDWIGDLLSSMGDAVLDFFGIGSPSKLMAGYGRDIGRGLVVGLRDITPAVADEAKRMADQAARNIQLRPVVALASGLEQALLPAAPGVTGAGGDGATTPDLAEQLADALTGIEVVVSETAVTHSVNRRNHLDRRR
jgi:phage-related protein